MHIKVQIKTLNSNTQKHTQREKEKRERNKMSYADISQHFHRDTHSPQLSLPNSNTLFPPHHATNPAIHTRIPSRPLCVHSCLFIFIFSCYLHLLLPFHSLLTFCPLSFYSLPSSPLPLCSNFTHYSFSSSSYWVSMSSLSPSLSLCHTTLLFIIPSTPQPLSLSDLSPTLAPLPSRSLSITHDNTPVTQVAVVITLQW